MEEATAQHLLAQLDVLDEAILTIASELDLDAVLQRIVDLARTLLGARYCALGIVGPDGFLSDFITAGMSATEREAIGDLPCGHGILGVLIREQRPLRLGDMRDDPRSVGFPPHHPPMTSFLGVPIRIGDDAIGNLYLTEKEGTDAFTDADRQLAERLARHAAIAVTNARRFSESEFFASRTETRLTRFCDVHRRGVARLRRRLPYTHSAEARATAQSYSTTLAGGWQTVAAAALARACWETIRVYGVEAIAAVRAHRVTDAVEKVAFGTLVLLELETHNARDRRDVLDFCLAVGLPVCFADLGVPNITPAQIATVAERALATGETIYNEPCTLSQGTVMEALRSADARGRAARAVATAA